MTPNYVQFPEIGIEGLDESAWQGYEAIMRRIQMHRPEARIFVVDCYPGVDEAELLPHLAAALQPELVLRSEDFFWDEQTLSLRMQPYLTDDPVRGVMDWGTVEEFLNPEAVAEAREKLENARGTVLIFGFAAAKLTRGDVLFYADLTRWEIQLRYRKGMPNYKCHNETDDQLRKVKRGFFVEWRIADRYKRELFDAVDYYLDTVCTENPKMITGKAFHAALNQIVHRPFRLTPYFDAGVWGGHWMKEKFGLKMEGPNFAWCFDGVPEENSLRLRFGSVLFEMPAMNVTLARPLELLGEKTYARFGAEFPIRFDMLDTVGGQNLSLQVHPTTEYIKRKFAMPYTQDESYYILDTAPEGGAVYLGLKKDADKQEMFEELRLAQEEKTIFDTEKYVNRWPAQKHDHFLIPAGTIHCSAQGTMVLEISATPYLFTFKLWDWGRVDLNGRPRPIHLMDGEQVIRMDRDTDWIRENCINAFQVLTDCEEYTETRTGLHPYEFIETRVFTVRTRAPLPYDAEFAVCNLVEGEEAIIESSDGEMNVHFAETFILPAKAGPCSVRTASGGKEIKLLCAKVRYGAAF